MSEVSDYAKIRIQELVMQVQKKDARIQRLREALSELLDNFTAAHHTECPQWFSYNDKRPCDCGTEQAEVKAREALAEDDNLTKGE